MVEAAPVLSGALVPLPSSERKIVIGPDTEVIKRRMKTGSEMASRKNLTSPPQFYIDEDHWF